MTIKAITLETIRDALEDQVLDAGAEGRPIRLVASEDDPVLKDLSEAERGWIEAQGWKPKEGAVLLLSGGPSGVGGVLLGTGGKDWASRTPLLTGMLPAALPQGDYRFASALPNPELAALGFLAGSYRFTRYKTSNDAKAKRLVLPEGVSKEEVLALAEALYFGRDLINTPANDLGPAALGSSPTISR
jgi:leucyl aminopeptidase